MPRLRLWLCGLTGVVLMALCAACGGGAVATPTGDSSGGGAGGSAVIVVTATPEYAADIPFAEGARDIKVKAKGTSITYDVDDTTVAEITTFYQEQLKALGWEQQSKKDSGFGDSITLLRKKPDATISVTIQSISGSNTVRVLISRLSK
jgi:hypothetical protein